MWVQGMIGGNFNGLCFSFKSASILARWVGHTGPNIIAFFLKTGGIQKLIIALFFSRALRTVIFMPG